MCATCSKGSVRRSANRVRISVQLNDANAGTQIWGDRFDRELADVFAVQDEITEQVAGAIEPELLKAEGGRAVVRSPSNLSVWDLIRQGTWHFHQLTEPTHQRSLQLFREAARIARRPKAIPRLSCASAIPNGPPKSPRSCGRRRPRRPTSCLCTA